MPIIVEIIGLPGSGKTTLLKQIVDEMARRGHPCGYVRDKRDQLAGASGRFQQLRKLRVFSELARYFITEPSLGLRVFSFAFRHSPRRLRQIRKALTLLRRRRLLKLISTMELDIIIVDAGFIHSLWAITRGGTLPPEDSLGRLFLSATASFAQAFVYIDVDVGTSVDRMRQRTTNWSDYEQMKPDVAAQALSHHGKSLMRIMESVVCQGRIPLLEVDGTKPILQNVDAIIGFLTNCVHGPTDTGESRRLSVAHLSWDDCAPSVPNRSVAIVKAEATRADCAACHDVKAAVG